VHGPPAIFIPGAICMLASGMVTGPVGEAVGRLICSFAAAAGAADMVITISGPPSTSETLSKTIANVPAAADPDHSARRDTGSSSGRASRTSTPPTVSASHAVQNASPNPTGSATLGVGPMTSPIVIVTR